MQYCFIYAYRVLTTPTHYFSCVQPFSDTIQSCLHLFNLRADKFAIIIRLLLTNAPVTTFVTTMSRVTTKIIVAPTTFITTVSPAPMVHVIATYLQATSPMQSALKHSSRSFRSLDLNSAL